MRRVGLGHMAAGVILRQAVTSLLCAASVPAAIAPSMAGAQPALAVLDRAGIEIARLAVPAGGEWCLAWAHSVTGGAVADCFTIRDARLVLLRSYLHDAAAGLGDLPGRGRMRAATGGGYWIEDIDEALPEAGLPLRIGGPDIGHVLSSGNGQVDLSAIAAGRRVILRPVEVD